MDDWIAEFVREHPVWWTLLVYCFAYAHGRNVGKAEAESKR